MSLKLKSNIAPLMFVLHNVLMKKYITYLLYICFIYIFCHYPFSLASSVYVCFLACSVDTMKYLDGRWWMVATGQHIFSLTETSRRFCGGAYECLKKGIVDTFSAGDSPVLKETAWINLGANLMMRSITQGYRFSINQLGLCPLCWLVWMRFLILYVWVGM